MRNKTSAAAMPRRPASSYGIAPSTVPSHSIAAAPPGAPELDPIRAAIHQLAHHQPLSSVEIAATFGAIMRGEASDPQIAAVLMGLQVRGLTSSIVAGAVRALRSAMIRVQVDNAEELVDTCGTGGGSTTTFNVSTAAAFVAAGAGVRIAKHGNRSFTSRSGSADVIEALGIKLEVTPESMARTLDAERITFMFAPLMHPAMRHVGPVRRALGVPTVMNVIGPLANPAGAMRQVIGTPDMARAQIVAGALADLGTIHSLVVHGEPGLDEISPLGITRVIEIRQGSVTEFDLDPVELGYTGIDPDDLAGGSPEENAALITAVFRGGGPPGARAAISLNAAAALYVSGRGYEFGDCLARAERSIDSGAALGAVDRLRAACAAAA